MRSEKPTFVVYGNCNAQAFVGFLNELTDIPDRYDVVWGRSYGTNEKPDLSRCEQLWVQDDESNPLHFPDGINAISFPPCNSTTLWPFACYDSLTASDRFPYGDDIVKRLSEDSQVTVENVWIHYNDMVRAEIYRLDLNYAKDIEIRKQRDSRCDVKFSGFFEANFRSTPLQMTYNHPRLIALKHVFFDLCERTGIDKKGVQEKAARWPQTYEPFDSIETPVLEHVATHFSLEWWSPEIKWRFHGKRLEAKDYIEALFAYRKSVMKSAEL